MPLGRLQKCLRGELQALQLTEFGVLVFDVHGHVRFDLGSAGRNPPELISALLSRVTQNCKGLGDGLSWSTAV